MHWMFGYAWAYSWKRDDDGRLGSRAVPEVERSPPAAGRRSSAAGRAAEPGAGRRSRLRHRQRHGAAPGALARGTRDGRGRLAGDAATGPRLGSGRRLAGGGRRDVEAGLARRRAVLERDAALDRRSRDAVSAPAHAGRERRRSGRADAAQLLRALAHVDLRGRARRTMARASREAHSARADEAARVLLGPLAPTRERARCVGDGVHAGVDGTAPGGRVREGLVAQAVPRRARPERASGVRERLSRAPGPGVSAARGWHDAVSVPSAVHRGAMLSVVTLTRLERRVKVIRHLHRLSPARGRRSRARE